MFQCVVIKCMPFVDFNELVNNDKIPLGLEMWYFKMPHPSQEALKNACQFQESSTNYCRLTFNVKLMYF